MIGLPSWYSGHWQALLLVQAFLEVLPFAWALARRRHGILGTIAWIAGGALFIDLISRRIWAVDPLFQLGGIAALYSILIGAIFICFDVSLWSSMFLASSGYISQNIASCVKVLLHASGDFFKALMASTPGVLLVDLVVYGGVGVCTFFLFRSFTCNGESKFNNRLKAVFSVIVLFVCAGIIRLEGILHLPSGSFSFAVQDRCYQILCSCFILALQSGILERADMSRRMDAMRELIHQQQVQFETSKQNAQFMNEISHDLQKMLNDFRGSLSGEQINVLMRRFGGTTPRTGNEILDILLLEKAVVCMQKEIQITCYAGESDLDFIEDLDLYFLMNNLLTNAMEATEKLSAGERFITINISRTGDMALLHMENSCLGQVEMENGLPKSQGDPRYHGFGMRSVARLVDKYDGSLAVKCLDQVFCVDITLFRQGKPLSGRG